MDKIVVHYDLLLDWTGVRTIAWVLSRHPGVELHIISEEKTEDDRMVVASHLREMLLIVPPARLHLRPTTWAGRPREWQERVLGALKEVRLVIGTYVVGYVCLTLREND